jgi:N-dimethylarginine dimethylaminohydrolase
MKPQPRILMCPPDFYGIEYEINPWMNRLVGADRDASVKQWQSLRDALVNLGVTIDLVDPVQGLPDLVFTANAGLVFGKIFIPSRFRYGVRKGEEPYYTAWAASHGWEVVSIPESHCFEGAGDALFLGETLFAGYRFRSDARGHQWIGARLGVEVLPLELVDSRYYHLDTCFCPLSATQAIYFPGAFDEYGRNVLRSRVEQLIEVGADEAASFSCNAVVVGKTVILNDGAPRLADSLRALGFEVIPLRLTEFIKAGGSAKCLTLRLDGEEAASWRQ